MAAYGSFHQIFEIQRQDKAPKSLLDTLISSSSPWNPLPIKGLHVTDHTETPPFTEIFGELHFRESSHSSYEKASGENSSLQLCTEGLGSESYYDLEDGKVNSNGNGEEDGDDHEIEVMKGKGSDEECGPWRKERREYPPAMTRMSFKTYREEGRLVLEEVRVPKREFLRASREDGRLRLKLVQPEDEDEDEDKDQEEKKDEPSD
ncbi:unnamed protein product [Eruca vesicaria subsp. sativa]|uniref:FAF domain-containing protein n=1 Tax=Eruca vesicaria subsp. sativa TaxID=29727 RepID=A0ABC8KUT5_ERUVS|nr:unnamed protein product [Eruca vesicaria subsp. sativa]